MVSLPTKLPVWLRMYVVVFSIHNMREMISE